MNTPLTTACGRAGDSSRTTGGAFAWVTLLVVAAFVLSSPARAQFDLGRLKKGIDTAKDIGKDVGKVSKAGGNIGLEEERVIGGSVALEIVARHGGLVREPEVVERVNLVGKALAGYSTRPELDWRFGVLASDTINAFSAPGGYVFITRGLYDLVTDDDALAAVLAHEIAHITERHALKIVGRGEAFAGATGLLAKRSSDVRLAESQLRQFDLGIDKILQTLFEKGFDPATEYEADRTGRELAVLTGYAPGALRAVLMKLQARQGTGASGKAVFSTHPPLGERVKRLPGD